LPHRLGVGLETFGFFFFAYIAVGFHLIADNCISRVITIPSWGRVTSAAAAPTKKTKGNVREPKKNGFHQNSILEKQDNSVIE
jgi:hypothetical protein